MKKTHAFTLIELLVVISIIAILAGFALPVFSSALERGRATEDRNNLSGLGKGIIQYLNDSDDTMFSLASSGAETWPNLLHAKYIKDWKAFRSPFDKVTATRPKAMDDTQAVAVSYGLNEKVFDTFVGKWKNSGSVVILGAPAVDTTAAGKAVKFAGDAFSTSNVKVNPTTTGTALGTHQSREAINVLFADGHAEQMDWKKYVRNELEEDKKRWDPMYEQ
jgi:prepilin-type N-terminal cleavage/methylation domain-containing protein/prepilin-type processing-associated H-X9-DG protein